jgi:hypothetical protein
MKANTEKKIDFSKSHKDLYSATPKIKEVNPGSGVFLSVSAKGAPGGPAFQGAVEKLYSLAYTLKFGIAKPKDLDFKVCCLECLYQDPCGIPKDEWEWKLMIRIPEQLSEDDLKQARKAILERKKLDTSAVKRVKFSEGRSLQVLHIGPYDQVGITYTALMEDAKRQGLAPAGEAHEIYIRDPNRVPPEKLKTIVRLPVGKTK